MIVLFLCTIMLRYSLSHLLTTNLGQPILRYLSVFHFFIINELIGKSDFFSLVNFVFSLNAIFFFFSFSFNTPFTNYEASRRSFGISINNSVHSGQDKKVCVCVPVSEAGVKLLPFGLPYLKSGPGKHETAVVQGLEVQGEF